MDNSISKGGKMIQYFKGVYDLSGGQQGRIKDWIEYNIRPFNCEEWEIMEGDGTCDYFLYDLEDGGCFRIYISRRGINIGE